MKTPETLYPLKFKPIYKRKIWGGSKICSYFGRPPQGDRIGESWELCCREDGMSVVENGALHGAPLQEIIDVYREQLVGTEIYDKYGNKFPLFIKYIDANDKLSVQVHPDDAYAAQFGESGKDEMWYIIHTHGNAKLVNGLKCTSKIEFIDAVKNGRVSQLLNTVTVKAGDFVFIPGGTVHAIFGGLLIAEIQQNSNTTYRIYDWGRLDETGKPRELHLDRALEAIRWDRPVTRPADFSQIHRFEAGTLRFGPQIKEFQVNELSVDGSLARTVSCKGFEVVLNIAGYGEIRYADGVVDLTPGDVVLLPASLGRYSLNGCMKMLITQPTAV